MLSRAYMTEQNTYEFIHKTQDRIQCRSNRRIRRGTDKQKNNKHKLTYHCVQRRKNGLKMSNRGDKVANLQHHGLDKIKYYKYLIQFLLLYMKSYDINRYDISGPTITIIEANMNSYELLISHVKGQLRTESIFF